MDFQCKEIKWGKFKMQSGVRVKIDNQTTWKKVTKLLLNNVMEEPNLHTKQSGTQVLDFCLNVWGRYSKGWKDIWHAGNKYFSNRNCFTHSPKVWINTLCNVIVSLTIRRNQDTIFFMISRNQDRTKRVFVTDQVLNDKCHCSNLGILKKKNRTQTTGWINKIYTNIFKPWISV